ncbi:Fe-S protein assembly co-chaperone HscB [Leptothrix ochracea]|uniref:Fe-S protein assembly co-chaperone HscB n=1 Tax=Leptothrix ochracea TaxID=735331 RepID=UPI0034E22F18
MKLDDNDFDLLGVPRAFAQDRASLDARWKALQTEVHPDRFAAQGAAAQRVAMQWAVRVNEAYQRLKDPIQRATQLCLLHGVSVGADTNTAMPVAFLMQQMAWREALDEAVQARDSAELDRLAEAVAQQERQLQTTLGEVIDTRQDWSAAAAQVRAWMFVRKFAADVDRQLDFLES